MLKARNFNFSFSYFRPFVINKFFTGQPANRPTDNMRNIMKYFLSVLGMVMVVEGLPYFAFPDKMKMVIEKVLELQDSNLRKLGFVLMLAGLGLVFLGTR
jgi:uncharacterized protein YjeT (DUF2065 family)